MSNDFEIHWQNYFTALDALAKAVIRQSDLYQQITAQEPGQVVIDGNTEWAIARGDTVRAQSVFYKAHLALKPFLGDDNE